MSKLSDGKKLSSEQSLQLLCRVEKANTTYTAIAKYLSETHKIEMGACNVGKILRGEISAKKETFSKIEKFLSILEDGIEREKKFLARKGVTVY